MTPFIELIDDYLEKKLSPAELGNFENTLQSDASLRQSMVERQVLRAKLRRLQLKNVIDEATADMPTSTPSATWSKWLMGAGAAVLVLAAAYFYTNKNENVGNNAPSEQNIPAKKDIIPSNEPRAETAPNSKSLNPADNNTNIGSVTEKAPSTKINVAAFALDSLDNLIADAPVGYNAWTKNQDELRGSNDGEQVKAFYEAYAFMKKGEFKKSNEAFKALAADTKFKNRRRAEWYLTLGELKINPSSNNENLNQIANTNGHFFQQKARGLKAYLRQIGK
jgi:hypothetical protein